MIILEALKARKNRRDGEMAKRTMWKGKFYDSLKREADSYLRDGRIFIFPLYKLVYLTLCC